MQVAPYPPMSGFYTCFANILCKLSGNYFIVTVMTSLVVTEFSFYLQFRDGIIMCFINGGTSILAGFVVFSILGYMSVIAQKDIAEIVKPGESQFH